MPISERPIIGIFNNFERVGPVRHYDDPGDRGKLYSNNKYIAVTGVE